jgi:hypothetical protein
MAFLAPATDSTVRLMRSSRAGVRTYDRNHEFETRVYSKGPDLKPYIIRDLIILDQASHEAEVSVAGSWVCDLDFFHTAFDQFLEKCCFLVHSHWTSKSLVPIPKICRQPDGCLRERIRRPLPIFQVQWGVRLVLLGRISAAEIEVP